MTTMQEQQLEIDHSPPRAKPVQYKAPLGTRWQKEKANAPRGAFDLASDPKQIGPWVLGECVGKGASGRVKVARHCETGQMAAVKILPLETVLSSRLSLRSRENKAEKHRNGIDKEIIMMKLMDHPNIVRIYDVFEGEKELFLVLEYVDGGELFDYLVNHGRMEPHKALCYFKQIIYGLAYAHAFAVIHRDLKPENILIASLDPPHVKIADWGMAAFAPPEHNLETSCGSPHYASPEIVRGEPYSGTATDIWSCGVILFALMTGRLPFDDKNIRALLQKVKSGKFEMPTYVFPEAADLITRMLVVDVNKRIKMSDILLHPFLQHSTSGITFVPAPSISELDKPLRSKALIKQDLLSSLLLICVGSTYDEIASELLSPPGQGSLIKALYFLLAKHRERTLEEYGMLNIFSNDGFNIKHYNAPPMKDKAEVVSGAHNASEGKPLISSTPPIPGSSHVSTSSQLKSPSTSATHSRSRPASPLGPRHPHTSRISQRSRRASSPHLSPDITGLPGSRHSDEVIVISGQSSQSSSRRKTRPRTQTVDGLPYSQQRYDPLMSPEILPSVSPRTNMPPPALPPLDADRTWFVKPTVDDPTLQRAIDDVAKNFNILIRDTPQNVGLGLANPDCSDSIESNSAMNGHQESNRVHLGNAATNLQQRCGSPYNLPNKTFDAIREEDEHDKENQPQPATKGTNAKNWYKNDSEANGERSSDDDDDFQKIEKCDVENDVAIAKLRMKTHRRGIPKKAKYGHHSISLNPGSEAGVQSPILGARQAHSISEPHNVGLFGSQVGEVKGWFANLFNWKAQQYILHSVDNTIATRDEAARILLSLGCHVILEEAQGWGTLRCRMDESFDPDTGAIVMKSVRFRVEFSPILGYVSAQPQATTGPSESGGGGITNNEVHSSDSGTASGSNSRPPSTVTRRTSSATKSTAPFVSTLVLVQEKGALSTFRILYTRLRMDWGGRGALESPDLTAGAVTPFVGTPRVK